MIVGTFGKSGKANVAKCEIWGADGTIGVAETQHDQFRSTIRIRRKSSR